MFRESIRVVPLVRGTYYCVSITVFRESIRVVPVVRWPTASSLMDVLVTHL